MPGSHPAVYRQGLAGDVARARTAEPEHGRGDLLWSAGAAHGNAPRCFRVDGFVSLEYVAAHLRIDQAGIHCIHADAMPDVFESGCPRQPDHAMLRCDIRANARVATQRAHGRVVDDCAAALTLHLPQFVLHAAPHTSQVDSDHALPLFPSTL